MEALARERERRHLTFTLHTHVITKFVSHNKCDMLPQNFHFLVTEIA